MTKHIMRFLFKIIYRTYLWSSSSSNESFLGSRSIEYPFVIEEIKKNSIPEGSKVLVVGCAGDPLSTILPALGYKTYGIDVKHVAIRYSNFHFIIGDIRKTEFPKEYFDVLVAISTIEHIGVLDGDLEGDRKAMEEMKRILKQSGIILITVPVASKFKVKSFERIYDVTSLNSLLKGLKVLEIRFYQRNEEGYWIECPNKSLIDSNSPAVALISAIKPAL